MRELGFAGERRALALLPLVAFGLLYLVLSLNAQPGWGPALLGLSLAYMVGFFAPQILDARSSHHWSNSFIAVIMIIPAIVGAAAMLIAAAAKRLDTDLIADMANPLSAGHSSRQRHRRFKGSVEEMSRF